MTNSLFRLFFLISLSYADQHFIIDPSRLWQTEEKNVPCSFRDSAYTCNCLYADENMVLPIISGSAFRLNVVNCKTLFVPKKAITDVQGLRYVTFNNIRNLVLREYSLSFPRDAENIGLTIEFNNVNIDEISDHTFSGNMEDILFKQTTIQLIRAFAFTALHDEAHKIEFSNVTLNHIEAQAFKKFTINQLEIVNTKFLINLPSRIFYDIEVTEDMQIVNCNFKTLNSRAFSFKGIGNLLMRQNTFEKVSGECFELNMKNKITISDNNFGITHPLAFKAITVDKGYPSRHSEQMELRFVNNTMQQSEAAEPAPLTIDPNFNFLPKNVYFTNTLTCTSSASLDENTFYKPFGNEIYFKLENQEEYSNVDKILNQECLQPVIWPYIAGGVAGLILIILIIVFLVIWFCLKRQQKRKLDIVVPESRTYRQTQIVLQIENSGLLKTDL